MSAYSMDLRKRVLEDCDSGMEARQVAIKYRVSESWIRRLRQRRRENNEIEPRTRRSREPIWKPHVDRIREEVAAQPDATLKELKEKLGLDMSLVTLHRALHALRLTFKKKLSGPRSRTVPMSLKSEVTGEVGKVS